MPAVGLGLEGAGSSLDGSERQVPEAVEQGGVLTVPLGPSAPPPVAWGLCGGRCAAARARRSTATPPGSPSLPEGATSDPAPPGEWGTGAR